MEHLKLYTKYFTESLPEKIINKYNFISKSQAIYLLHFPKTKQDFENAKFFLDNIHNIDQSLDSNYYKTYFKYYKANSNYNSALDSINRAISLSNKQKDSLKLEKAIYLFENNKINETLEEIKILKSIKIEKKGLLEKVLKFEYDLYGKLNDYEMQNNILKEIKKYDPTFKK